MLQLQLCGADVVFAFASVCFCCFLLFEEEVENKRDSAIQGSLFTLLLQPRSVLFEAPTIAKEDSTNPSLHQGLDEAAIV